MGPENAGGSAQYEAYRASLAKELKEEPNKEARTEKLTEARTTKEYTDAKRWHEYELSKERKEKTAARFDDKVTELINDLDLGAFKASPRGKDRPEVGVTPEGKLSGYLYGYQVIDETSWRLFNQMQSGITYNFQNLHENDIVKAIGIVMREEGLKVYKSRDYSDGLIIVSRDGSGRQLYERDKAGKKESLVAGAGLHTLYNSDTMFYSTKNAGKTNIFADGLDERGEIYKQGEKLLYQPESHYNYETRKTVAFPAQELEPFTMTKEELRDYTQKREGGRKTFFHKYKKAPRRQTSRSK